MSFIQILYIGMYILLLSVPFLATFYVRKRFKSALGVVIVVSISALLMSSVVITQWLASDWYLESKIEKLDRDGDGIWSPEETASWTAEDKKNMGAYIGDGGRNVFAAIIFPMFSLVYSFLVAISYWLLAWLFSRRKNA